MDYESTALPLSYEPYRKHHTRYTMIPDQQVPAERERILPVRLNSNARPSNLQEHLADAGLSEGRALSQARAHSPAMTCGRCAAQIPGPQRRVAGGSAMESDVARGCVRDLHAQSSRWPLGNIVQMHSRCV